MVGKLNKKALIKEVLEDEIKYPVCELNFNSNFELLVAVLLSAQTTDKKVNLVTPALFAKYGSPSLLAETDICDIEEILKSLGIYKQKARYLKELGRVLHNEFNDVVPSSFELLTSLPGVGSKTAMVVRAVGFQIPEFAVDTHIYRITLRLGLRNESDSVDSTVEKLKSFFDRDDWISLHHRFILFGRTRCKSRNPLCSDCRLKVICNY